MITSLKFDSDTLSNTTNVVPLVYIEKPIGDEVNIMGFSTYQLELTDINDEPLQYHPLLLNIPSISEKINIETRKFVISSVTLNLSNMEYLGEKLSDKYNLLINSNVYIYYKTQSANTLEECLKVYSGKVKRINHSNEDINLILEDMSQEKIQKQIPKNKLSDNGSIVPKYRNKPIPLVYGMVNKSPCVLKGRDIIIESEDITGLAFDHHHSIFNNYKEYSMYVHDGDETYANILPSIEKIIDGSFEIGEEDDPIKYKIQSQWYQKQDINGYNTIVKLYNTELLKRNGLQVRVFSKPSEPELVRYTENLIHEEVIGLEDGDEINLFDADSLYTETLESIENLTDNDYSNKVLILDHPEYLVGSTEYDIDWNLILNSEFLYYQLRLSPIKSSKIEIIKNIRVAINGHVMPTPFNPLYNEPSIAELLAYSIRQTNLSSYEDFAGDNFIYDYSNLLIFDEAEIDSHIDYAEDGDLVGEEGLNEKNVDIAFKDMTSQDGVAGLSFYSKGDNVNAIFLAGQIDGTPQEDGNIYQADLVARFKEFDTSYLGDFKDPLIADYYANVYGRKDIYTNEKLIENLKFTVKKTWVRNEYLFTLDDQDVDEIDFFNLLEDNNLGSYNGNIGIKSIETDVELEDGGNVVVKIFPRKVTISLNDDTSLIINLSGTYSQVSNSDSDYYEFFHGNVEIIFNNNTKINVHNANPQSISNYNYFYNDHNNNSGSQKILNKTRIKPIENISNILKDILIKECNLSEDNINQNSLNESNETHEGWFYGFTQKDNIQAKDLIEDFCKSSQSFARFRGSDNSFVFNTIKDEYTEEDVDILIINNDILKYSYDRTKLEDIYTNISVLYNIDYSKSDTYSTKTDQINVNQLFYSKGSYDYNYYGIDQNDEDNTLEFKSPYIRTKSTAIKLRNRLLSWHMNTHNIINITLPLPYALLEVGDIIAFDKEIQGLKLYGETYTTNMGADEDGLLVDLNETYRNGQLIYPYFMIYETKKSIDKVEIKLIQLHHNDPNFFLPPPEEGEDVDSTPTGDVNLDGNVNVLDIVALIGHILGTSQLTVDQGYEADLNQDSNLNILDVVQLVGIILR